MKFSRFIAIFLLAASIASLAENLLRNVDFMQLRENGQPAVWYPLHGYDKLTPTCGVDKEVVPPGYNGYSYRITGKDLLLQNSMAVKPGHVYRFRYKVKTIDFDWMTMARFQVIWHSGKEFMLKDYRPKPDAPVQRIWDMKFIQTQGNVDWKEYCIESFTAPPEAKFAVIRIGKYEENGTCWFADISMEECPSADPFMNKVAAIPFAGKAFAHKRPWSVIDSFVQPTIFTPSDFPTVIRANYDEKDVHLDITCNQPDIGGEQFSDYTRVDLTDGIEVLLFPPNAPRQFHIIVNPGGKMEGFSEDWLANKWPTDLRREDVSSVKCKVHCEKDRWIVSLDIPFAWMNWKSPDDGEVWRASFCRNVSTRGKELSGWAKLDSPHFQNTNYFGRVVFKRDGVVPHTLRIDADGAQCEAINISDTDRKISCAIVTHRDAGSFQLSEKSFTLKAGETLHCDVPFKDSSKGLLWCEMRGEDGKLLAKSFSRGENTVITLEFPDPEKVRTQDVYIATDHPFFISWSMKHNIPSTVQRKVIPRSQKKVDFFMEVPEKLVFRGMVHDASAYGWMQTPLAVPTVTQIGDRKRYKFELPRIVDWSEPQMIFYYDCSMEPGQTFSVPCWFEVDGSRVSETVKTFKTMKIGSVKKAFDKITFNVGMMDALALRTWLPKNTLENYRSLGFNCLSIPIEKKRSDTFYSGDAPKTREDNFDLLYQEIRAKNLPFYMCTLETTTGAEGHVWTRKDPDAVGKKRDGSVGSPSEYGAPPLCFTYRGEYYKAWIDKLCNSSAFDKYHITWLGLDMELWRSDMFEELCYCPRCQEQFKQFCIKNNRKDLAELDATKADSPDFKKFWRMFQEECCSEFLRTMIAAVESKVKGAKPTSPWGAFTKQDYGSPGPHCNLDDLDFFAISLYNTPDNNYRKFKEQREKYGMNKDIFGTWLSYGQTMGCPDWHMTAVQCKENIFEVAIWGSKHIVYYFNTYLEPLRMKYIVDAINILQPLENMIREGRIEDCIAVTNEKMLTTCRRLGDEHLLAVRSYHSNDALSGDITLKGVKSPLAVIDCETGKTLATVTPDKPSFNYSLPGNVCRLLYIGPQNKWNARH